MHMSSFNGSAKLYISTSEYPLDNNNPFKNSEQIVLPDCLRPENAIILVFISIYLLIVVK